MVQTNRAVRPKCKLSFQRASGLVTDFPKTFYPQYKKPHFLVMKSVQIDSRLEKKRSLAAAVVGEKNDLAFYF